MSKSIMDELKELLKRITGEETKEKKLEQQVTGSLVQKKEQPKVNIVIDDPIETSISAKPDPEQVEKIMEQILDLDWVGESLKTNHAPVYFLNTKKTTWIEQ